MGNLTKRTAFWILLFVAYALVAASIRITHIETLTGDDAESFLWSRTLEWGYGVQPPLYAWLHWAVNRLFGETLAATVAMRALCHVGIGAGAFALARRFAPVRIAGLAALGVFLVPEVAQTFLRTRTHNMLATALAPLVVLAFLRLLDRQRWRDHALFGAAAALGILAKATLAILPLALVLAALTRPDWRAALRRPRVLVALGLCAALLAGPALWLWGNAGLGTASLTKFAPTGDRVQGLFRLLRSLADSFGPAAAVTALAVLATRRATAPASPALALVWRTGGVSLLLILAGLAISGASEVKERWLVPVLIPLVPVALARVMQRQGWARMVPATLGGAYGLAMLAALPAWHRDRPRPSMAPYAALAATVARMPADLILGGGDVAANLWLSRPGLPVRAWVAGETVTCRGTVMLIVPAPGPADTALLARQSAPCRLTPLALRETPTTPEGPVYRIELLRLTPPA